MTEKPTDISEFSFRNNKELRASLSELLNNHTLRLALSIIENDAKPRTIIDPRQGAHLDTITSHRYHFIRGIQYAVDKLKSLETPPPITETQSQQQQPFEHLLPKEMLEAFSSQPQQPII